MFYKFCTKKSELEEIYTKKISHVILFNYESLVQETWKWLGGRKRSSQSDNRGTVCDFCDTVLKPNGVCVVIHPISLLFKAVRMCHFDF